MHTARGAFPASSTQSTAPPAHHRTAAPRRTRGLLATLAAIALATTACSSTTETAAAVQPNPGGVPDGGGSGGELLPPSDDGDASPGDQRPPTMVVVGEPVVPNVGAFVLRDHETGTLWNLRGEAFAGPLAEQGAGLRPLPAYTAFWFAWSVFEHDTDVWRADAAPEANDVPPIEPASGCEVPCNEIISGGPPKDGIPSVDHDDRVGQLTLVDADDAGAAYLAADDRVLGVVVRGPDGAVDARAYSHNVLWWHEIANDVVGGSPVTISFCPLTGSGMVFPGGERGLSFGTSGRLFNSNLVMYDRVTDSLWSQMLRRAVSGPLQGERLPLLPVVDTTWARWKALWPETKVTTTDTGHARDYSRYPYGDYREDHRDTFRPTRPPHDPVAPAKTLALGVRVGDVARAYLYDRLDAVGARAVVEDTLGGVPLMIVWDREGALALPFDRRVGDQTLTFEVVEAQ